MSMLPPKLNPTDVPAGLAIVTVQVSCFFEACFDAVLTDRWRFRTSSVASASASASASESASKSASESASASAAASAAVVVAAPVLMHPGACDAIASIAAQSALLPSKVPVICSVGDWLRLR